MPTTNTERTGLLTDLAALKLARAASWGGGRSGGVVGRRVGVGV